MKLTSPPQVKVRVLDPQDHKWLKDQADKNDCSINYVINQAIKLYKQIQGATS